MTVARLSVWPPLPPDVYARSSVDELPFPLGDPGCLLFSRARHGLWHGVRALGLAPGDEVLTPAYHHGSEVEALFRAGLGCRFYEGGDDLVPDEGELESLLSARVRALYLIHYLGFPQDAGRWRRWCDERGLLLLEDAAQAWLATSDGRPLGLLGDLSIFCLYKTVGVPDGAALLCRVPASTADGSPSLQSGPLFRRHAAWLAGRSSTLARLSRLRKPELYDPNEDFGLGDPDSAPSTALDFLLRRLVDAGTAGRRRANYELLLGDLGDSVPAPFGRVAGASPFAFPLYAERKAELLERLGRKGIGAVDFWSIPHPALPTERFPRATELREHVVALPVHQELALSDVERIPKAVLGRARTGPGSRVDPIESLDSVREEWSALAAQTGNIFATWEWTSIWWRHFGRGRDLLTQACYSQDGRLFAILPLYLSAVRPLRMARFLGHREADHLGPICGATDRAAAARALLEAIRRERLDLFVGENVPADEGWSAFLGAKVLRREGSPVLRFRGASWDELLAGRSANFREQVRRRERKLRREHEVRFRLSDDPERLHDDLDILFSLHSARWKGGGLFTSTSEGFHREFAVCAQEQGWLRLWVLEVDGAPAAAWYGFRFGDAESYYQAGRDPGWSGSSVGFVLLAHTIREALEDGVGEYRFLEGGEDYKYRFTREDSGLETIGLAQSTAGMAAVGAARTLGRRPSLAALARRVAG
ncbi:MAG TPA: GNAT family N-acetyltransferase [Gaiellaceae bacterium]|nr:GNAT family N-acetyltransferase [Gaiellaceae bacterium]